MPAVKVQASLPYISNLPEDVATNTWYFAGTDTAENIAAICSTNLIVFYQTLQQWLSGYLTGKVNFKCYDVADPEPRVPIFETSGTFTPSNFPSLPEEVALCMSYHVAYAPGIPPASQRGRLYLGPFSSAALGIEDYISQPDPDLVAGVVDAAEAILAANNPDFAWMMYSPTRGALEPITGGWVDNAWDTQRRRGHRASARSLWA